MRSLTKSKLKAVSNSKPLFECLLRPFFCVTVSVLSFVVELIKEELSFTDCSRVGEISSTFSHFLLLRLGPIPGKRTYLLGPGKDLSEVKAERIDIIISRLKRKIIPEKGTLANPIHGTGQTNDFVCREVRLGL